MGMLCYVLFVEGEGKSLEQWVMVERALVCCMNALCLLSVNGVVYAIIAMSMSIVLLG